MGKPGRELIPVELQKQGHYTNKEGGITKRFGLGAKTSGISYLFFVCFDSEICQIAASGFIFLHLQNRATTAQPSEGT